ncbi:bifunctional nicotinamide-nucleotide adenylyltransferase/Nudix hydroxylase [Caulobacter sp. 17J65-9]|uniref:bifunctional nicotinamide-nucleotide adenylyltransferase/Nudix hydroxylase n=1 Tax=Caulobacter sp. 17J65-9 TaxID=2709382 RepID=UPI0013CD1854|nr:bifunctional nicotinamide-nucleotide adenylyltransferase/Nudix hydroxylase [Caulobacter sp. 17J65-9]NEX93377.1 bifunctional nicotinamide-nucleotide adenylyltransferase/Nudix hydroxylase [Caulobacter sp. 17J65-9]
MPRFDYAVCIGRFEPFHLGHLAVLRRALDLGERAVVLIGSADAPRSARNPWTYEERAVMIRAALGAEAERLIVRPLVDHLYNETAWVAEVQDQVAAAVEEDGRPAQHGESGAASIALVGHDKDASSQYLAAFPQWERIELDQTAMLSATDLRRHLFSEDAGALRLVEANVPPAVFGMLAAFRTTEAFAHVAEEFRHVESYKAAWAAAPYPPTFVTADAVVVHSGHVLMVKRKAQPGRGLWALPGGFVDQDETTLDAAVRELREETRLKIPAPVLRGSLKGRAVFDHPYRSMRGRTITHAFHFDFPAGPLPAVRGGDDAVRARWIPVAEARRMRSHLFEDHFFILEHFLGAA